MVMADELALNDGAHSVALRWRTALPVDAEALPANGALNVGLVFSSLQ
jgi:hypothetical protein